MAISVIVAGLGVRGRDWIHEVSSHRKFSLAACVDPDRAALERARARWVVPSEHCFTQLEEALEKISCEAVIVATPAACHLQNCQTVLGHGRGALVEKPFTLRLPEAINLVKLAEKKEVPIVVGQNYRYMRSFRTARRIITAGALGRMGLVVLQYYRVPHEMSGWLKELEHSVLWGVGVHHLDALRYSLAQNITGVFAESFTLPWSSLARGATMQVMLRFEGDTRGLYTASYESSGHEFFEKGQEFYARYVGERATLHVFQRWLLLCETGRLPRLVRRGTRHVTEETILLDQLHDAIVDGKDPDASGRDNLQTMAVIEACLESARERSWKNPQQLLADKRESKMRVLAIGLDAAEPTLVRQLIDAGELPAFKKLLAQGSWIKVKSSAEIGSGAVWPSFITGTDPAEHGIYGEWCWRPETMSLSRYHGRHLNAFWKKMVTEGASVGLLDVPFAPFLGLSSGFEISEWGAHDTVEGRTSVSPASVAAIVDQIGSHPYTVEHLEIEGPAGPAEISKVNLGSVQGVKLRGTLAQRLLKELNPDLAIIVFPEIHHSSHFNWHTIAHENPIYDGLASRNVAQVQPTLIDIYREIDHQIGGLLETVGEKTGVLAFSLHGIRPTLGIVTFLEPLMCELGFARLAGWTVQSWRDRSRSLLAATKRRTPTTLKNLYYQTMPKRTTYLLARPTMMPAYDWSHTRAFAMQTDQHGRIRLNLRGREARGIVPPEEYDATCVELEELLRALKSEDGSQLVHDVIRPAKTSAAALELRLPDLIIHWRDAAFKPTLKIEGIAIDARPSSLKYTGQHALDGFCIVARNRAGRLDETIQGRDLHRLILQECELSKAVIGAYG